MLEHRTCLVLGWVLPLLVMSAWSTARLLPGTDRTETDLRSVLGCPFITDERPDLYLYQLPIFCLLLLNTTFLGRIMMTVLEKLQSESAGDVERRHYKAAKALVVVTPLLGNDEDKAQCDVSPWQASPTSSPWWGPANSLTRWLTRYSKLSACLSSPLRERSF